MAPRPLRPCGATTPTGKCRNLTRNDPPRCDTHAPTITLGSQADRARRRQAIATHTAELGNYCPGWNTPPHYTPDLTADHLEPTAEGGDPAGDLTILCRSCNARRTAHWRPPR